MDEESRAKHVEIIAYANALSTDTARVYSVPMTRHRKSPPARSPIIQWVVPILLLAATLPLYLAFRSISLDDFDSYSFAMALGNFDVLLQQPQPPGFPIYVAMGRAFLALFHNPTPALTTLGAFSGAASVLLVYAVGRELVPRRPSAAAIAAGLFAVLPITWLTAEKALSDMPGLMWTLLAIWLWLRWRDHRERGAATTATAAGAGFVTGLALGVRPQNTLPIVLLVGELLVVDLSRGLRKTFGVSAIIPWLAAGVAGIAGVLLWLVPVASAGGGLNVYLDAVRAHSAHVGRADSLFAVDLPPLQALRARATATLDTLLTGLVGTGLYLTPKTTTRSILALTAVLLPGLVSADWRRPATRRLGVWAAMTLGQIVLFENLERPRLFLPLVPWIVLLIASGVSHWSRPRYLRSAFLGATTLGLFIVTTPLATTLSQVPSPPAQAAAYVVQHYPPAETLVAAAGSFRAAQVELPQYPLVYLYEFDAGTVVNAGHTGRHYTVILDRDQFPPDVVEALSHQGAWVTLEDRVFTRDRRVHTQHDQVRMVVLAPPEFVPAAALELPPDGCVDIGVEGDGRYLGEGWFRPETISGTEARWAGRTLTTTVRLKIPPSSDYVLRLRALAFPPAQSVSVHVNGMAVDTLSLPQAWTEVNTVIPQGVLADSGGNTIALVHATATSPFQTTGGGSSDQRDLTAAYDWLCVVPDDAPSGGD